MSPMSVEHAIELVGVVSLVDSDAHFRHSFQVPLRESVEIDPSVGNNGYAETVTKDRAGRGATDVARGDKE